MNDVRPINMTLADAKESRTKIKDTRMATCINNSMMELEKGTVCQISDSFVLLLVSPTPLSKLSLKGAKEVSTTSQKYRKFIKRGQVKNAVEDLNRLKWTGDGLVGDARVELRTNKGPRSTILVFDPNDYSPLKSVYLKDMPTLR